MNNVEIHQAVAQANTLKALQDLWDDQNRVVFNELMRACRPNVEAKRLLSESPPKDQRLATYLLDRLAESLNKVH
jgi:hypothetical protein